MKAFLLDWYDHYDSLLEDFTFDHMRVYFPDHARILVASPGDFSENKFFNIRSGGLFCFTSPFYNVDVHPEFAVEGTSEGMYVLLDEEGAVVGDPLPWIDKWRGDPEALPHIASVNGFAYMVSEEFVARIDREKYVGFDLLPFDLYAKDGAVSSDQFGFYLLMPQVVLPPMMAGSCYASVLTASGEAEYLRPVDGVKYSIHRRYVQQDGRSLLEDVRKHDGPLVFERCWPEVDHRALRYPKSVLGACQDHCCFLTHESCNADHRTKYHFEDLLHADWNRMFLIRNDFLQHLAAIADIDEPINVIETVDWV